MGIMKNRRNSDSKRIKEIKDISDGHFRSMHTTNKAEKFKFSKLAQGIVMIYIFVISGRRETCVSAPSCF